GPEGVRRTLVGLGQRGAPITTVANVILGTPRYLTPEQIDGTALDARADVYALGITLYEALAGSAPFDAGDITELLVKILCEKPEPLDLRAPEAGVPPQLARVIERAIEKQPSDRYASAADFAAALWGALAEVRTSTPTGSTL